ncbi:MAG: hypothetical protein ACC683_11710 [Acidimicrobiia bacterium]
MASKTVRRSGYRIEVTCPGRPPVSEDDYDSYLSRQGVDGAVFFTRKNDPHPVGIGSGSSESESDRFSAAVGGAMADAVVVLLMDGSPGALR